MAEFCPECQKKDFDAQLKERDYKAELEKAVNARDSAIEQLNEALKNPQDFPLLSDFIAHCEDGKCERHAKQLEEYQGQIAGNVLANLVKPENKPRLLEVMKTAGIDEAPTRIVISGIDRQRART
uniref:Uncharacterized protein n=1 Tax=viral metagenome TaxID=1070528 RepID=A0A6M3IRD1_9ZZZZ